MWSVQVPSLTRMRDRITSSAPIAARLGEGIERIEAFGFFTSSLCDKLSTRSICLYQTGVSLGATKLD